MLDSWHEICITPSASPRQKRLIVVQSYSHILYSTILLPISIAVVQDDMFTSGSFMFFVPSATGPSVSMRPSSERDAKLSAVVLPSILASTKQSLSEDPDFEMGRFVSRKEVEEIAEELCEAKRYNYRRRRYKSSARKKNKKSKDGGAAARCQVVAPGGGLPPGSLNCPYTWPKTGNNNKYRGTRRPGYHNNKYCGSCGRCPDGITSGGVYMYNVHRDGSGSFCVKWSWSWATTPGKFQCKGHNAAAHKSATCTKAMAAHIHGQTNGAGILVMKRTRCRRRLCKVFKVGLCLDVYGDAPLLQTPRSNRQWPRLSTEDWSKAAEKLLTKYQIGFGGKLPRKHTCHRSHKRTAPNKDRDLGVLGILQF